MVELRNIFIEMVASEVSENQWSKKTWNGVASLSVRSEQSTEGEEATVWIYGLAVALTNTQRTIITLLC